MKGGAAVTLFHWFGFRVFLRFFLFFLRALTLSHIYLAGLNGVSAAFDGLLDRSSFTGAR